MISVLLCAAATNVEAQPAPQPGRIAVKLDIIATGMDSVPEEWTPTELVPYTDNSGRLMVQTLGGQLRVIDSNDILLTTPLMTNAQSNNTVPASQEAGATGLAFHPDFGNQGEFGYGKFYTITTEPTGSATADFTHTNASTDHQDVIREWDMSAGGNTIASNVFVGDHTNSREIMRVDQAGPYHNAVDLAFSPLDGHLYISSGDGNGVRAGDGGPGRFESQLTDNIYGNVLRINPDTGLADGMVSDNGQYLVPNDNPFVGNDDFLPEIFAYGFRSPYRMNFDRQTGDLWLGDVGQQLQEEVDLVLAGENYGWSLYEGTRSNDGSDPTGLTFPVFEYDHSVGRTVIGGFIYRGSLIPELEGMYMFAELGQGLDSALLFYGDPATGEIFEFQIDPTGPIFPEDSGPGNLLPDRILSIGEDLNGELYLVAGEDPRAHAPSAPGGFIIRLTAIAGDFNHDGIFDCVDADALVAAIAGGSNDLQFDLTGDSSVDGADLSEWLAIAGAAGTASGNPYLPGDANLNGIVDFLDFNVWAANRFTNNAAWCLGDFDASGTIDFLDFNIWAAHRFQSSLVPEPRSMLLLLLGCVIVLRR
jgi:glucose/arabinose dehydrogenase